jgi:Flp pilus assembly protein TadD
MSRLQVKREAALIASCIALLCLASCSPKPQSSEARQKTLNEMKGPEVDSIKGALLKQVDSAVAAGDFGRALSTMKQILDKEPDNAELILKYADLLRRNGAFEDAIKAYSGVLSKNPSSLDALEGKALSLLANGDLTGAGTQFGEVLKVEPKRWRSLNAIGILFALKNMDSEANSYFNEALVQSNNSASVLNNIGLSKAFKRDYEGAVETLMQARSKLGEESPDLRRINLNLALVYGIMGRLDEVQRVSEKYLSQEQLYNNLGFYAILSKDENLAKTYLNMALTQSPKYYERAWNNLDMISSGRTAQDTGLPQFKVQ